MPKISVIIPVYNVEEYLPKCLDSVTNQTLEDIEIICIDDGSTDNSLEILKNYAKKDSRIIVLNQETNQGQGVARNRGLQIASGEYIGFVDSDDWIELDFYEKLYKSAVKYNADIATTNMLKHKKHYKKYNVFYRKQLFKFQIKDKIKLCGDNKQFFFYVTNKIYKSSLVKKVPVKFAQGHLYEDVQFAIQSIFYSNAVVSVPNTTYHYIGRKNSSVKSIDKEGKKQQDLVFAYSYLQDFCKKHEIELPERLNYYTSLWYNPFVKTYIGNFKYKKLLFGFIPIRVKNIKFNFPIDLVYLWVDGNDPEWIKKKNLYQQNAGIELDEQAVDDGRFVENDELKYSLRSVEKYASWINKIYIVTDSQVPKWLNINHPKIKVVFHKDFIPKENLPLFNSEAIECYLPYIPNLSEHFLYACDDMLFGKYIDKFFFFTPEGKPIIRLKHQVSKKHIGTSMFTRSILLMQALIYNNFEKHYPYAPHHNIDAYLKSKYLECMDYFLEEFKKTMSHKFRSEGDIQRVAVTYYLLAKNYGKLKRYSRIDRFLPLITKIKKRIKKVFSADSIVINMNNKNPYRQIRKYNPCLFCVNDGEGITDFDRKRTKIFLEETFPEKSSFEL